MFSRGIIHDDSEIKTIYDEFFPFFFFFRKKSLVFPERGYRGNVFGVVFTANIRRLKFACVAKAPYLFSLRSREMFLFPVIKFLRASTKKKECCVIIGSVDRCKTNSSGKKKEFIFSPAQTHFYWKSSREKN